MNDRTCASRDRTDVDHSAAHSARAQAAGSAIWRHAAAKPQALNATLEHMTMEEIISFVDGLDGVLTQRAQSGDGSPEIAWGDTFFYYAPDGVIPSATQPFATTVTKKYPGDETSPLKRPGVLRVNIAAVKEEFISQGGRAPRDAKHE